MGLDYKVLIQDTTGFLGSDFPRAAEELADKVSSHVKDGWRPLGGICCAESHSRSLPYLMQAMIRDSDN